MTASIARKVLIGCLFVLAYVALDYISYVKPYRGLGITPWNPQPGLSIALVFLGGVFYAPFVLLAPGIADASIRDVQLGFWPECLLSLGIGGTYLMTGLVLQRWHKFDPRLRSVQDVLILVGAAVASAGAASLISAIVLLGAYTIDRSEVATVLWRGMIGDLIGILIVTPFVLLLSTYRPWPKIGMRAVWQGLALVVALVVVFGYREATAFQLFYLLFLPVLWVSLSDGPAGSATALVLVQVGLIVGAEIRFGPDPGLGALQALMIALAMTGHVVSALVAERQDTAARLREQQGALNRALRIRSAGEVAATIAHEISQPITALNTYSGVAAKAIEDGNFGLAANAVAKVESESARAAAVLSSMKEFLRLGTLSPAPTDLRALLSELAELLNEDLAKRSISLAISVSEHVPIVTADRIQLQQAIHNLIVNSSEAIQGVGRPGRITVRATADATGACSITVQDNGPGFPPGFNFNEPTPFTSTKPEGSGLGLGVARSIAEAHGGRLTIASTSRGVTATLTIPKTEVKLDSNDRNY